MNSSRIFLFALGIIFSFSSFAQNGFIRGTVIDDEFGDTMIGVTVLVKGTSKGAVTDFDGKFSISIEPGTYELQVSFVSFETMTISGLKVVSGETVIFDPIRLAESVEELEAVIITADVIKTSEAALLTVKKKSANLIDGISSASFKKIGDSDAGGAIKRVTGVSVEGGKYVYVRGLGDRYTKTMMNGVDIPGLDPDRNSLQIDIFPTNLLNNMVIVKSATADLPADFTGGLVNIETKDFPDEKIFDVSFSITYNPSMHFKKNALTYQGSSTDWLGFDTGLRTLPSSLGNGDLPRVYRETDEEVNQTSHLFSQTFSAAQKTNFMNYSFGISAGNQKNFNNGNSLGYIFSGSYRSTNQFFQDAFFGNYQKRNDPDQYELGTTTTRSGSYTTEDVLLGGLGGVAYKTANSKYRLSVMHLQNGEKLTADLDIVSDPEEDDFEPRLISNYTAISNNLQYSQRSLTNAFLSGEHHLGEDKWVIDWKLSPTLSRLKDPDIRKASFSTENGRNEINAGAAGSPTRLWRFLDEVNYVGKVDVVRNATAFSFPAKFKLGASYIQKERSYSIQKITATQLSTTRWADDASFDDIVSDENLFPSGNRIYYIRGLIDPNSNGYDAASTNLASYLSAELSFSEKLKTVIGLRLEDFELKHTGRDQNAARTISNGLEEGQTEESLINQIKLNPTLGYVLDNDVVLSGINLFPSFNANYELTEKQNLRFSYARTIARPSFKEMSYAQILDPVSNRTFNGGFFSYIDTDGAVIWDGNLKSTNIDNIDVRWEFYPKGGELFSVSAFYKAFDSPIELVRITISQTGNEFQPRNVGNGQVLGAEFEFRKNLDFVGQTFSKFNIYGNLTLVKSRIDMTAINYQSRLVYNKTGQPLNKYRAMAGQAPYVVNMGLQYSDSDRALDAGLFYNVKGSTLIIVGEGFLPDVYAHPFNSLNFNLIKSLGVKRNSSLNFKVTNILNDVREELFYAYNGTDQHYTRRTPGTSVSLGFKHSF